MQKPLLLWAKCIEIGCSDETVASDNGPTKNVPRKPGRYIAVDAAITCVRVTITMALRNGMHSRAMTPDKI